MNVRGVREVIGKAYGSRKIGVETLVKLDKLSDGLEALEKISKENPIANIGELFSCIHDIIDYYGIPEMDLVADSFYSCFNDYLNKRISLSGLLASLNSLLGTNLYLVKEDSLSIYRGARVCVSLNLNKLVDEVYKHIALYESRDKAEIMAEILTEKIFNDERMLEIVQSDERLKELISTIK